MDEVDALPTEKKSRRFTFLLAGVLLGVLGTLFVPPLVRPYLPAALRGTTEQIEGSVFRKQLETGEKPRLLLSVDTDQGAVLATFTRNVAEIDMLVDEGDMVTLGVGAYEPFVSDPIVASVHKGQIAGDSVTDDEAETAGDVDESPAASSIWSSGGRTDSVADSAASPEGAPTEN
jgi:small basic protein